MMEKIKLFEEAIERLEAIEKMDRNSKEYYKEYDAFYDDLPGWKCELFNKYYDAKHRGNQFIDFNDCPSEKGIPALVDCLRECGVQHITISSGWSSLVERMWVFCQAGCRLDGMIQINSKHKDWETGEYSKQPAFLLNVGVKE